MIGGPWALGRGSQAEAGWAGPSQRALPHRQIWISLKPEAENQACP